MAEGETVVKCARCEKYFVHTKAIPECPFCHAKYGENEERIGVKIEVKKENKKPKKSPSR